MRASEAKWGDSVWPEPMDVYGLQEANLVTTQSTAVQIHLFSLPLTLATENTQMWFGERELKGTDIFRYNQKQEHYSQETVQVRT